jgi:hypothetical protein
MTRREPRPRASMARRRCAARLLRELFAGQESRRRRPPSSIPPPSSPGARPPSTGGVSPTGARSDSLSQGTQRDWRIASGWSARGSSAFVSRPALAQQGLGDGVPGSGRSLHATPRRPVGAGVLRHLSLRSDTALGSPHREHRRSGSCPVTPIAGSSPWRRRVLPIRHGVEPQPPHEPRLPHRFPVCYRRGAQAARIRVYHQSSHLGEEFLDDGDSSRRWTVSRSQTVSDRWAGA